MFYRKYEFSLQLNQIADALILAASLYISYALRGYEIVNLDMFPDIPPLENFFWLFIVVCLFGPLLLEMQGYYQYPLEKSVRRSLQQIAYAGLWAGLIIGVCVIFLKLNIPSRSVFLLFLIISPVGLLIREAVFRDIHLRRLRRGEIGRAHV